MVVSMLSGITEDQISAVHSLKGRTLKTGWYVKEIAKSKPGSTGGNFSVCYIVEKDGKEGFLKALNIMTFLRDDKPDVLEATTQMLNNFNFEKELLTRCRNKNLSKVSRLLEADTENIPGFLVANVYYLIFERADDDVRNYLNFSNDVDFAWKLRSLHNIAAGIKQLHSIEISHQDIKPSNIFVYNGMTSKLGDLGRSLCQEVPSPFSSLSFTGDLRYAPPEVFHGFVLPNWKDKVFAIDCFLLGSLAAYYITGQNMTALLSRNVNPNINIFKLNFENALPYWIEAFDNSINIIESHLANYDQKDKLIEVLRMLSHPNPKERGHIKNIAQRGCNYNMERFVGVFNLLAKKAEYKITN